jgi:ATP-dependent Lon protease
MPRRPNQEEEGESTHKKSKVPLKRRLPSKKRGPGGKDDDSDVDTRGNIAGLIAYSDDDEEDEEEEDTPVPTGRRSSKRPLRKAAAVADRRIKKELGVKKSSAWAKQVAKKAAEEEEEDDGETLGSQDTEDEDEEEDDEDTEDEEDDDEEEEEEEHKGAANLILTFGGPEEGADRMIPQRHNMKKESPSVKKFVKLLTAPLEDNTIDTQIDQFKALSVEKQTELLTALEKRPTMTDTGVNLMLRILTLKIPTETQALVLSKYNSLQNLEPSSGEYFKLRNWLDKIVSVPFGLYKELPVKMGDGSEACATFMKGALKSLDEAIYGQEDTKLQILQYITTKIANPDGKGMSLLLVGPPGIGKTSVIKNGIAKAMGWPFQFISLGGDSDASTYTGHQLVYESSHCGKIVNSLISAKSMSTVLLFDEVDKVSTTPKGEEVQNMLIHLTDPASNEGFEDKYLSGVSIDLSKVMFVFSANDITKIDRVLLDRLMVIELKGYDLKQKVTIAEQYLLPAALKEVCLAERVAVTKEVLSYVIETYANDETGVRELKRSIDQIVQKINMLRMYNTKELPFHIPGFALPFVIKKEHVDLFLKKKEKHGAPPFGMYT